MSSSPVLSTRVMAAWRLTEAALNQLDLYALDTDAPPRYLVDAADLLAAAAQCFAQEDIYRGGSDPRF